MKLYTGVVENRRDPLKLGRCQVRIVGLHTEQKTVLPTKDLPWAFPMQPVTSAAMNGIGHAPVGPVEGTWVIINQL
jgi:Gp5 N-terminal OB domain